MKLLLALATFLFPFSALAGDSSHATLAAVKGYSLKVLADYREASHEAHTLKKKIGAFTSSPSASTLAAAKKAWISARHAYSVTEVYRFYQGPIDDENGPEGLLNAWPLDEAYLDSVVGKEDSGIINDLANYPEITKELLVSLNEKDGETNISTGFHAIEFLLWGQDLSETGPGNRSFEDFVAGKGKNADRRAAYLLAAADLLVEHLDYLVAAWEPTAGTYASTFRADEASLKKILLGAYRMAGEELAHERMFVAVDGQQQEDEQSCFSDNTHNDIRDNFAGIKNVLTAKGGPLELVRAGDAASAKELAKAIAAADEAVKKVPAPFDQAIFSEEGREKVLAAVTALEDLAVQIKSSSLILGISLE